ncbi:MAG: DUF3667 domain-containing protein [Longimicrobiaceae bacterium]
MKEFLTRSLSLESGLLHTFVALSLRPGRMIREYVYGRRQQFTNPVGYLLLSAAASVAVWPLRERSFLAGAARTAGDDKLWDGVFLQVTTAVQIHPVFSALLVCCFFVPLQRLLFPGRITIAESFVYALFLFGHAIMLESLLTPVAALLSTDSNSVLDNASSVVVLYLLVAAAGGYFGPSVSTFLKTVVVIMGACLGLVFVLVMVASAWYLVLLIAQGAAG